MYTTVTLRLRWLWSAAFLLLALLLASCASGATATPQIAVSPQAHTPANGSPSTAQAQPAPPLFTRPITYVALGASDAVGVGSDTPGAQGYVPLVAAHLAKGSHVLNLGISGIRLHEALTEELPLALDTSPNLVTIWLVANDFVGGVAYTDYMQDLYTLLKQLRTHTRAFIVIANLPDLTRLPAFANQTAAQRAQMLQAIMQWNTGIAQEANRNGVALVNLFSQGSELTAHPDYISGDGFHPSPAGYARLADLFWQAIRG